MLPIVGTFLLLASNPWNPARAADLFISPSGDDAAAGTEAAPFRTLARAAAAGEGSHIWLLPGTHVLTNPIALRSGMTLEARPWGSAVLDAGWSPAASNRVRSIDPRLPVAARGQVLEIDVKAAGLPALKPWPAVFSGGGGLVELYDGATRLGLARWPDAGETVMARVTDKGDVNGGPASRGGTFEYHEQRIASWAGAAAEGRLWLEGCWYAPWRREVLQAKSIDPAARRLTFAQGLRAGLGSKYAGEEGGGDEPWHAVNLVEALDRPGEWCADFAAQKILYWPVHPGAADGLAVLWQGRPLLAIKDATNVVLRGLVIQHGLGTAVEIRGGEDCVVEACEIRRIGDNAVAALGGLRHQVRSCDLHTLGGAGLVLAGGDRATLAPAGHEADNNHIHDFGLTRRVYAPGVVIGGFGAPPAVGCRVAHNRIHGGPHAGMLLCGNDNVIELNEIYDVLTESDDMGGIYSTHEWISFGNVVRHNFIHHSPRLTGTYMDDGDSGDVVEGNVYYRIATGPFIGGGHHNVARGNIAIACLRGVHVDARGVDRGYGTEAKLFKQVADVKPDQPPWSARFPELATLPGDDPARPRGVVIEGNVMVACEKTVNRSGRSNQLDRCRITNNVALTLAEAGFADPARLDFTLDPDSAVFRQLPGFTPIPFRAIGLYTNALRRVLAPRAPEFARGLVPPAGDTNALASSLWVDSPAYLQVVQRDARGRGRFDVSGRVGPGVDEVRYRIGGRPVTGELADAWTRVPVDAAARTFRAPVELPAGGWYRMEVFAYEAGHRVASWYVDRFGVGEVFVVAGQSNAGNHGAEKTRTATRRVSCFDGKQWHIADDPMRGASGSGGSFLPAFGDALVARLDVPVGLVALAVGATSVREWLPAGTRMTNQPTTGANVKKVGEHEWEATGGLFAKLAERLAQLGTNGCRAVLWHQGESDAGQARGGYPADRQITGDQYAMFMQQLISATRARAGWEVPWVTALATYHSEKDAADEEFRAAQRSLWAKGLARPGPDTDELRGELRAGVHFSAAGLARHGERWAESVGPLFAAPPPAR